MHFGLWEIFQVLGSLAFFIYGMKLMSDGIQRAAGHQMRNILRTMTKNRFLGVFTGFLITALVQSSSATTVMTVSFVNAGLLNLVESVGVMMGANVGTTITGWIISLLGFKIKLSAYSIPIFAIAIPMLLSNKGKIKHWGEFFLGFAILFMGLSLLKGSVPDLKGNPEALAWMTSFTDWGFFSRVLFVMIGTVVTVIIQSSSAAMAVTLTMVSQGWLPLDMAAAMILGENIGTTITAQLASLVGNTSAKRAASIHSMLNLFGVVWMIILLPVVVSLLEKFMLNTFQTTDAPITLAAFHTFFNFANVILLIGFVPFLVQASKWLVKGNEEDEDEFRLKFIGSVISSTPELATVALQKEVGHFGEVVFRMSTLTKSLFNATERKKKNKFHKKIRKYEKITDRMEIEITQYVTNLSSQELTDKTSLRLRSVLNICNDLERIGDIYFQLSKTVEVKDEEKLSFNTKQHENINTLSDKIGAAFQEMVNNLNTPSYDDVTKDKAVELENEINTFRNVLRGEHLDNLSKKDYDVKSAMIYNTVFHALEKVGDHIINVTEAVIGEI